MAWVSYFDRRCLNIFLILHLSSQQLDYSRAFATALPKIIAILAFLAFEFFAGQPILKTSFHPCEALIFY